MDRFPAYSAPTPLYLRALALDLVPRRIGDLASYALPSLSYNDEPVMYAYAMALLVGADLAPEQREQVVRGALAYARRSSSHPEQGVHAFYALVSALAPHEQAAVRDEAQPVLAAFERYVRGRDWAAPWGSLLRYRDRWRVLRPDTYDDWLKRQGDNLLSYSAWSGTPASYREHLAHVHLFVGVAYQRVIERALDAVRLVDDGEVTADREWAFAGGRIYNDDDVEQASRAAQVEVLTAIAPILPAPLHARARALAEERGYDLGDLPGSALADPFRMRGALWYHALPDPPVPWLTPSERYPAFAALDVATRDALIDRFVDAYERIAQEFLRNRSQRAVAGDPVAARFRCLLDDDLPVAARYLDVEQCRRLLTLYQ